MTAAVAVGTTVVVLCLSVPAWVYFGYPVLLVVLAAIRPRPVRDGVPPRSLTVIVPAHDEEDVIERKVRNVAACDGAADVSILVASDGSTDRTVAIVRELAKDVPRLAVLDLPHDGKAAALNAAAGAATTEILAFSDADAMLERGSLVALLAPFGDPEVGGVVGHQRFRRAGGAAGTGEGDGFYWRFDAWLKTQESAIGSAFGAGGSLHAVRRELYVPIADPAQADDMAISMRVPLAGRRLVFAKDAVAWGTSPTDESAEFRRKVRVVNHSLRSLLLLGPRLWTSGFYSLELVSHKLLRHLTPLFLVPAFVLSLALAPYSRLVGLLLLPQVAVYLLAGLGWVGKDTPAGGTKLLAVPYWFCFTNAATLVGAVQALSGRRISRWERAEGST